MTTASLMITLKYIKRMYFGKEPIQIEICFHISRNAIDLSSYFYMRTFRHFMTFSSQTCPLTFACAHYGILRRFQATCPLNFACIHQTYWNFSYPLGYFCMKSSEFFKPLGHIRLTRNVTITVRVVNATVAGPVYHGSSCLPR